MTLGMFLTVILLGKQARNVDSPSS